jgi:L,D-peptidoglycan transpeptidase YkuD (ErfK/YbiS/YcfS/YnhG family)
MSTVLPIRPRRVGPMLAAAGAALLLAGCGRPAQPAVPAPAPVDAAAVGLAVADPSLPAAGAPAKPAPADPAPAPASTGLPAGVPSPPAGTDQLVTVLVPGASSTSGTLQAWRRSGAGWSVVLGPVRVKVGTAGVGPTHEGLDRTPRGTFALSSAFGRQPNPGTKMRYRQVSDDDWWVSDQHSPDYNTYRHCAPGSCAFNEEAGENLGRAGASYDYAVVIGYNIAPVRAGAGSAFFVHVDAGAASQGCVETPRASVIALLRWLDPGQRPEITIGYG